MLKKLSLILLVLVLCVFKSKAKSTDHLFASWKKQVGAIGDNYLRISYRDTLNKLQHSFKPWQQTTYASKGILWLSAANFVKSDTLKMENNTYFSKYQFTNNELLFLDYGDKDLFPITNDMFADQAISNARYTPVTLINYFYLTKVPVDGANGAEFAVYKSTINKTIVKLYIRKSDNLVIKITTLNADELFGDVLTTYHYADYNNFDKVYYPKTVSIEKINGKVHDEVRLAVTGTENISPVLLQKPESYKLKANDVANTEVSTEKYNDHIYLVKFKQTDSQSLIVEFNDFLVVAEAPMNSENGEMLIREAKKIAPKKPIKYFVFGHYHPDYIGGIRAFDHRGAIVLAVGSDMPYVNYLTSAAHSLKPDSLQMEPKALKTEEIKDSKVISDGRYDMKICFIGDKSAHTNDYLIYYFPGDKLLFEDDAVWISKDGPLKKASARQAGLYNAVKDRNLNIDTIIQSWPVSGYGVKSFIPFNEIEDSIKL